MGNRSRQPRRPIPGFSDVPACRGVDLHQFFAWDGEKIGKGAPQRVRNAARDYCSVCPVRQECRRIGKRIQAVGLWGGHWMRLNADMTHAAIPLIADAKQDAS